MTDELARAVVGWLALTMQSDPGYQGLLAAADKVTYSILTGSMRDQYSRGRAKGWDGPIVVVHWRGGPLADTVAAELGAAPNAPFPVTVRPPGIDPRSNADVTIGEVLVLLGVTDAEPAARSGSVRTVPPWRWPEPLTREGAARAIVIPQPAPGPSVTAVTVLQMPVTAWPPEGTLMIDTQRDPAPWAAAERHRARTEAFHHGGIRLYRGDAGWGLEDARHLARTEVCRFGVGGGEPTGVVAVKIPRPRDQDLVYLRVSLNPHHDGLDITATLTDYLSPQHNPETAPDDHIVHYYDLLYSWPATAWTYLAPAVLAAAQQPDGFPPDLLIHPLGPLAGAQAHYTLTITPTTPTMPTRGHTNIHNQ